MTYVCHMSHTDAYERTRSTRVLVPGTSMKYVIHSVDCRCIRMHNMHTKISFQTRLVQIVGVCVVLCTGTGVLQDELPGRLRILRSAQYTIS